ncbi:MAG TPA: S1 RNA-binding domain-containing protein, partial [Thermoanaerobaculia bacterium]|nr:S1 RNA-binding domain-containing protein [Thermoanaerobaculia bacterium]
TDFGAFVEIEEGVDGLIHVSDMSWTKRIKHPSEVLKKGDEVRATITHIDPENRRISLSIKEFMPNEWEEFKKKHQVGSVIEGTVTRIADFGVFVNIDGMVEGLMHVSETPLARGQKPQDHYAEGQKVRATILRIEDEEMKVGLSSRDVEAEAAAPAEGGEAPKKKRSRKKAETADEE